MATGPSEELLDLRRNPDSGEPTGGIEIEALSRSARLLTVELTAGGKTRSGTVVAPGVIACKASLFEDQAQVSVVHQGMEMTGRRIGISPECDLAFYRCPGLSIDVALPDVRGPIEGTWLFHSDPPSGGGLLASRVSSARRTPVELQGPPLRGGLEGADTRHARFTFIRLVEKFSSPEISEMLRELDVHVSMLSGKIAWIASHPYPSVIAHDGFIDKERLGGPVLDRSGRLVGIDIQVAGCTTFLLPIDVVFAALESVEAHDSPAR